MRAVYVPEFGGPEVLETRAVDAPEAGAGEVVVAVAAADVMFLDTRLRAGWGREFFKMAPPYVPGGAVGGVVESVGAGVDPSWIGKRVATRTVASRIGGGQPIGGYAEKAVAEVGVLTEVPEGVSVRQAVALVHDGRTAKAAFERAAIASGEWVLITAAAGGLGILLTQFAHAAGAQVIAAARGAEKLALASRLGADVVVDYSEPGWADTARAATGGAGPQVVLDGAGGDLGGAALRIVADNGSFLGYGSAAGEFATGDAESAEARGVTVYNLFDITTADTDWQALAAQVLDDVRAGRLEVVIGQTFALEDAEKAHAAIESRAAIGRTLLLTDSVS
ncbi:zinc-binding dehydrogenase [Nocardia callitridis]|uniref:Zinc-binding dehydrogenase n=1 Tax=Nocardia callitridis TaxID=648753 RepID=A0ABP9KFD3_9NOCA